MSVAPRPNFGAVTGYAGNTVSVNVPPPTVTPLATGVDRREQILLHLFSTLKSVPGFATYWRDRGEVPPEDPETKAPLLPAAIMLDGKEQVKVATTLLRSYGTRVPPMEVTLLPQVWVVLMPAKNVTNVGQGEALSAFRIAILKAIVTDDNLVALLGGNGEIEYRGSETDMQSGSSLLGQMRLDFALTYALNPAEF